MITDDVAKALIEQAKLAVDRSHPKNPPNLRFGSAVLSVDGSIHSSSAFWSDTLTLAVHAEHAALVVAAAAHHRQIRAIACISTEDEAGEAFCHPCGICKQLIYENSLESRIDVVVVMANLRGEHILRRISELVPFPWPK